MQPPVRFPSRRLRGLCACLALVAALSVAWSCLAAEPAALGDERCMDYLPDAERYYDIPKGLLTAIALTESGRDGRPDPWALNIDGQAQFATSYAVAVRLLRDATGAPRLDAAVGCMQIYMRYHLADVGAPEWVLKPRNNVRYAAAFLRRLFDQYGDWRSAVAHYNAADWTAQQTYLCQVGKALALVAPRTAEALSLQPGHCDTAPSGFFLPARSPGSTMAGFVMAGHLIEVGPPQGLGVAIIRGGPQDDGAASRISGAAVVIRVGTVGIAAGRRSVSDLRRRLRHGMSTVARPGTTVFPGRQLITVLAP